MNPIRPDEHDPLMPMSAEEAAAAVENAAENPADDMPGDDEAERVAQVIAALQDELAAAKDQTLRALADAENIRKRALKEREDAGKYAISSFARDLLDFADNFQRALSALADKGSADPQITAVTEGIAAMEKDLFTTFEKHGIQKITPIDQMFDPNFHEAMFEAPGTGKPAGTVIQVIEPGYVIKDRLLRPARVGVAKGEDGAPQGGHVDTSA